MPIRKRANSITGEIESHIYGFILSNTVYRATQDDIHGNQSSTVGSSSLWTKGLGGIAGRGILIDYYTWASGKGIEYNPLSTHAVPLDAVKDIARENGIEFRPGDILFLRTGEPVNSCLV